MKLIVTGATGYVATEVIRQALASPNFDTVVAVARRPVTLPSSPGSNPHAHKLKNVVIDDYPADIDGYPAHVKTEFAGASGCIWTVAITPIRSTQYKWETVQRVNQDAPVAALKTMHAAGTARPFTFVHMSGPVERDPSKKPPVPYFGSYLVHRVSLFSSLDDAPSVYLLKHLRYPHCVFAYGRQASTCEVMSR